MTALLWVFSVADIFVCVPNDLASSEKKHQREPIRRSVDESVEELVLDRVVDEEQKKNSADDQ